VTAIVYDYVAMLAGITPADATRYAMVIMVYWPQSGDYYGGSIDTPVCREVMRRVLLMAVIVPTTL